MEQLPSAATRLLARVWRNGGPVQDVTTGLAVHLASDFSQACVAGGGGESNYLGWQKTRAGPHKRYRFICYCFICVVWS